MWFIFCGMLMHQCGGQGPLSFDAGLPWEEVGVDYWNLATHLPSAPGWTLVGEVMEQQTLVLPHMLPPPLTAEWLHVSKP